MMSSALAFKQHLGLIGVKAGHKPGSVLPSKKEGDHLSGIAVTDNLERRTKTERGK